MSLMKTIGLIIASVLFLALAGYGFSRLWPSPSQGKTDEALTLTAVVLIGLALVVILMAMLGIVYSVLGLANSSQALALPEGSIRALIAFSLVLIFICMASFLYNNVNTAELNPIRKPLTRITQAQLTEMKTQFVVVYEPATKTDGSLETDADGKTPLYNATYFSKRSTAADDFAKQIFTTLATVFVSVISFYFGSSVTSSAVGAGARAARDAVSGGDELQASLVGTQAAAHDAQTAADQAAEAVKKAKSLAAAAPADKKPTAEDDAAAAQKASDTTSQNALDTRSQVEAARKAVSEAAGAGGDAGKVSSAAAAAAKARDAAKQLAEKAKLSAAEAERLLNKIKSDTGAA